MGHELGHQLDGGTQADTKEAHQVGVLHAGHDQGLLGEMGQGDTEGLNGMAADPSFAFVRCASFLLVMPF